MFKLLVLFALCQVALSLSPCAYSGVSLDDGYASYASYGTPISTLGSSVVYPYSSLDTYGVRCARQVTQTGKNNVNAGTVGGSIINN